MDLVITILLTVLFLLLLLLLFRSKKQIAKNRLVVIGILIFFIILASIALYKSSLKIKQQRFMSGGGATKRKKLLNACKLPENYHETSHCFNDSTHQTCCMLGPEARKYADTHGNPIGEASERAFKEKFGRKPKPNEKTGWCTCFGSEVCSYYANKFNDSHIEFLNNPKSATKVVKNVSPKCEGYWRDKFKVNRHRTPSVGKPKEINSNFCSNRNAEVDI